MQQSAGWCFTPAGSGPAATLPGPRDLNCEEPEAQNRGHGDPSTQGASGQSSVEASRAEDGAESVQK